MLTERTKKLYKKAIGDDKYLTAIKIADGDDPPGMFAEDITKAIFAAVYYGYLVGLYGDKWDEGIF